MAWHDAFSSKERVAKELAEHEVSRSPLGQAATTLEQFDSLVDCTKQYLMETYDKSIIVEYLDKFHR